MDRMLRVACWANAGWMAFVWITRINNAVGDATLSTSGEVVAYSLSAVCLVGAVVLAFVALRRLPTSVAVPVGLVHAAVWVVRGGAIAIGSRAVGFKIVHVALAIISIGLAAWMIKVATRFQRATNLVRA